MPGILKVNLHWLPTSVMGTASLNLLMFSVTLSEPSPETATAKGEPSKRQLWSLTQFHSDSFSLSRISVKKCVLNKRTIKVCVSCF